MTLTGEFVVLKDKKICKFTKYSDIPESFEQVISFKPDYPEGPHTEEEHKHMESFNSKLQELLSRASGN
tara:strand:- start:73 stop:279 length:207 start_codon:yes stop_codon:yes gene_type:complete